MNLHIVYDGYHLISKMEADPKKREPISVDSLYRITGAIVENCLREVRTVKKFNEIVCTFVSGGIRPVNVPSEIDREKIDNYHKSVERMMELADELTRSPTKRYDFAIKFERTKTRCSEEDASGPRIKQCECDADPRIIAAIEAAKDGDWLVVSTKDGQKIRGSEQGIYISLRRRVGKCTCVLLQFSRGKPTRNLRIADCMLWKGTWRKGPDANKFVVTKHGSEKSRIVGMGDATPKDRLIECDRVCNGRDVLLGNN